MYKYGKTLMFVIIIILSLGTILLRKDLDIKENVYVVSKSESENISKPKIENTEVYKEKENIYNLEKDEINKNNIKMITIFVSGEVKKPGVVTIESNKRLSDAINQLGGFTDEADLNKINLAMRIKDEKHYIIPKIGNNQEILSESENINNEESIEPNNKKEEESKININTASVQELDALPGVGEATANKIINYRDEKGKFNAVEEIKNVNGIGDKKYEDLKNMISIK